jgi:hypothetical protein
MVQGVLESGLKEEHERMSSQTHSANSSVTPDGSRQIMNYDSYLRNQENPCCGVRGPAQLRPKTLFNTAAPQEEADNRGND